MSPDQHPSDEIVSAQIILHGAENGWTWSMKMLTKPVHRGVALTIDIVACGSKCHT